MEAQSQLERFNIPRCTTVFISCPGDLMDAKRAVAEAVQEVNDLFGPHGWQVTSWRHETQGRPGLGTDGQAVVNDQVPADYDIYLGLMCRRLGTPTPRAPSGTVEEFLRAQQSFIEIGKPDILFYFCDHPTKARTASERLQLDKVNDFRKAYPGLFATFHTIEELKALAKHHLIDLLLRGPERRLSRRRGWALWFAQRLDCMVRAAAYLDRSSAYVVRSMGKLETLLDLPSLLSHQEYEALLAAQYLRALRLCGDDLAAAYSRITESFPMAFDWESAVLAADLTDADPAPVSGLHKLNCVRCGFLAALLRLSDALDLDHAAITTATASLEPPADGSPIENWLAYLTRRVEVSRGGVVTFHLAVPVAQKALAPNFRRNVALIFDACWHNLRAVLSVHGVAVVRGLMQSAPSCELMAVPNAVLAELDRATRQAEVAIRDLQHFGQELPSPVVLEHVLPLPYSAIARPLPFTFHPDLHHKLHLSRETEADARELTANQPGEILLDPAFLSPPGTRYRWSLQRDDGDFFSEVASGLVWQLAPADQMRLEAGESLPDLRYALLLMLGLHNDLVRELWPKLVSGEASRGECACVYDAFLASYDWLYTNAPESGQVELIRNSGNWIRKELLNKKGNQL